jgi:hypothetical protein
MHIARDDHSVEVTSVDNMEQSSREQNQKIIGGAGLRRYSPDARLQPDVLLSDRITLTMVRIGQTGDGSAQPSEGADVPWPDCRWIPDHRYIWISYSRVFGSTMNVEW